MKKIFTLLVISSFLLLAGCSKDFLKSYNDRIVGTWRIADVKRVGLGGSTDNLPFTGGSFTFNDDGSLQYTDESNTAFTGTWKIVKKLVDTQTVRSLQVTAIDFTNQQILSEYYDDIQFVGTDHFKANIKSTFHTYVTHFRR